MTENDRATASFRFPSFFYNYSYSPYSASYAENRDGNLFANSFTSCNVYY